MKTQMMKLADLKPYTDNAKKHDETQIKNVMQSIKDFGIIQPLVVDKDNVLIIGHCRLIACKRLKLKEAPVVRLEDLTPEEANKLRLLDNKLNESEWDFDLLADQIPELDFSDYDIDWELPDIADEDGLIEDEVPDIPEEPISKLGDIWQLGAHRLVCGDSTDSATINNLMDGEKADMVFTDPPYNANYKSRGNDAVLKKGIKNDNMDDEAFTRFIEKFMEQIQRNIKKGGSIYICCNWKDSYPRMYFECIKRNFNVSNCIVWNKKSAGMGWQDYRYQFEFIIYAFDMGKGHNFYGDRTQTDIWECSREPRQNYVHPTQKPVEIPAKGIKNSSLKDEKVLDLFGGSGSTLMACEQLGRKCYACELDPHYVDVIIQRYINFKGSADDVFCLRDGKKIPYKEVKDDGEERG